jgi:hypothetical protein
MQSTLFSWAAFTLLTAAASGQADVIRYTFDAGDAANSAVPGVGDGVVDAGVGFAPGGLCSGAGDVAARSTLTGATCQIDTGWVLDLGASDWTVGMWVDQTIAGNGFQYFFGSFTGTSFRCFGGTGGDMFLSNDGLTLNIIGGASTTAPRHLVWTYDSSVPEVRGYLDCVLNNAVATAPLNVVGTLPLTVMRNRDSTSSMLTGNTMDDFRIYRRCVDQAEIDAWFTCGGGSIGTTYCSPAVPNSTTLPATISASGSAAVADNNVTLIAQQLPPNQFGYFLNSMSSGLIVMPSGSQGNLCVIGSIGRYTASIYDSGATGSASLALDLPNTPTPGGPVAIAAGETWHFTSWYRDVNPTSTSNFTDAVSITFN